MRGAWDISDEYILELHTERIEENVSRLWRVAHVTVPDCEEAVAKTVSVNLQ